MSPSTETRDNREFATEIKFLVVPRLAAEIHDWAHARLAPDPNATGESGDTYRITSLYYDNRNFDVFHRKGSFGRSKYRIRRYGQSEVAFLERKLKTRGLLAKRRSIVPLQELARLEAAPERGWPGHWFHRRLVARNVNTICQISYQRTARVAMTDFGPIRLTLDHDIRTWPAPETAFNGTEGGTRLSEQHIILELKYRRSMPAVFKCLVEEFALNPQTVSKYRLAVAALGYVTDSPPATQTMTSPEESWRARI